MGDRYSFVVTSPAAAFNAAGSWQDLTNPGNVAAPGPGDSTQFINNTATVTGTGAVLSILFLPRTGTQTTIWTASVTAGSAHVGTAATLLVQGGISNFGTLYDAGSIVVQPAPTPTFRPAAVGGGGGTGGGPELDFARLTIIGSYTVGVGGRSVGTGPVYLAGALAVSGTVDIGTNKLLTGGLDFHGATPPSTIAVSGGGLLNDGYAVLGGAAGTTDTATVSGAGSKWTTKGGLIIGTSGTGSLTVGPGGTVSDGYANIGNGSGSGSVLIQGATWTQTGNLSVGAGGTGALDVAAGSTLTDGGDLLVGFTGNPPGAGTSTGTATIEGGSTATVAGANGVDLGERQGDSGSLTVTGGMTKLTVGKGGIYVGYYGTGTLDIASTAAVTAAFLNVGTTTGSPASDKATIESGATLMTTSGAVGGSVAVNSAAWLNSGGVVVGGSAGSPGRISASGSAGTLGVTGKLVIGNAGTGTVALDMRAAMTVGGALILGQAATGSGRLTTMDLATFSAASGAVGQSGTGTLDVHDYSHGTITGALTVGNLLGATGTVAVDTDALLRAGTMTVGNAGDGVAEIGNYGVLTVDNLLVVAAQGSGLLQVNTATATLGAVVVGQDPLAAGTVDAQAGAIITDRGGFALNDGGKLTLEGGSVSAVSYAIDNQSTIGGYGVVSGAFVNAGQIIASGGGKLRVIGTITGTGQEEIGGGATLSLEGAVARAGTIGFLGAGTLQLTQPASIGAGIAGFGQGDTIDLVGQVAKDIFFDPLNNTLVLTSATGILEALQLRGNNLTKAFSIIPDGAGGTDILADSNRPTPRTLGDLSGDTYNPTPSTSLDGFSAFDSFNDGKGFYAVAYRDAGNNIVIAYRGTVPTEFKNLLADSSWATGKPSPALVTVVTEAVAFLQRIDKNNPGAHITLTGHSLGGALAQLVGNAAGLDVVTFDAPGPAPFVDALASVLAPAAALNTTGHVATITNYRLLGDQVSQVGQQLGLTITEASPYPTTWLSALDNHSIAALVIAVNTPSIRAYLGYPDKPLAGLITNPTPGQAAVLKGYVDLGTFAAKVTPGTTIAVDPTGAGEFAITDTAGSDPIHAIGLPDIPAVGDTPGVASWVVQLEDNGAIVQTMTVAPDSVITDPTDFTGAFFTPLDAAGDAVTVPPFVFTLGFNEAGNFSTELDEQCYAAGTLIATPCGAVPVERLRRGDRVLLHGGRTAPVRAVAQQRIDLRRHRQPEMVWPVRILAGAVAAGIPARDLVVSPDHAVLVDGALLQARRLLNGATIRQEPDRARIAYHHVMLDRHALLLAEGLPAESFLPTARRTGGMRLTTDAVSVEPIWRRLAARAETLGVAAGRSEPQWTTDPALHLVADGRAVSPVAAGPGGTYFVAPPGTVTARLVSRRARPTDRRPWLDDRRLLGVQIAGIALHRAGVRQEMPAAAIFGAGWHAVERTPLGPRRWTDGDALLPIRPDTEIVEVVVSGTVAYPSESR